MQEGKETEGLHGEETSPRPRTTKGWGIHYGGKRHKEGEMGECLLAMEEKFQYLREMQHGNSKRK